MCAFLQQHSPELLEQIEQKKELTPEIRAALDQAVSEFKKTAAF